MEWKETQTTIDFSKHIPIDTSNSLHIYSETYLIGGKTYKLVFTEDPDEPLILVLDN
jgi:hypothetical protein